MVDDALNKLNEKYDRLRENLMKKHQLQLEALQKEDLSPEEYQQRRDQLLNRQQLELSDLERLLTDEQKDIERGALRDWEVRRARAKLDLKEKHYKEYANALREFNPKHESIATAEGAAAELDVVRKQLDQERKQQETKLKKEQKVFDNTEEKRLQEELDSYNLTLEEEMERDKQKHQRNLEALGQRKEDMIKEKKQKLKEELEQMAASGTSKEEQDQIIQAHQRDLQNLVNKIDADKLRMQSNLQKRLKKRREDKLKSKENKLHDKVEESKKELSEQQRSAREDRKADEVQKLKEALDRDLLGGEVSILPQKNLTTNAVPIQQTAASGVQGQVVPQGYAMTAPLSDTELTALLMASPLYHKLEQIKKAVSGGAFKVGKQLKQGEGYIDARDVEWTKDDKLVPEDLNKLNGRTFVVYKFGCFVIDLVAAHCQHAPVTLLLANKIPPNEHLSYNAYRNSFYYDAHNRILYMRTDRLDCVGQFILVLVHILAHIKAGDLQDDSNPDFSREFYRALSVVCDDLFFARCRRASATARAIAQTDDVNVETAANTLLSIMFGDAQTEDEKVDVVKELMDTRILPGTDGKGVTFTPDRVKERMDTYGQYATSNKLRSHLGGVEEKVGVARSGGSEKNSAQKLGELLKQSEPKKSSSVLPQSTVLSNLTGHALWQTFINDEAEKEGHGDERQPVQKPADAFKQMLQDQVTELEDRLDKLHADFSDKSARCVELQEEIKHLETEVAQQTTLKNNKGVKETTAKLKALRGELQNLQMKQSQTSEKLDECQRDLTDKQGQLYSAPSAGNSNTKAKKK